MHVVILGTYPPTQCGIATFTHDVESSLRSADVEVSVIPVTSGPTQGSGNGNLDSAGWFRIRRDDRASYVAAARHVNGLGCDIVLIQHEFGIFGGPAGSFVLDFVEHLHVPYAATLHTVLPRFSDAESAVIQVLCGGAAAVTVFTKSARQLVLEQELVPARRLHVLAHGAPSELYADVEAGEARRRLALPPHGPVMSTFGLLSPGKGIELAIRALALLANDHPELRYVIAGRTHPEIARREGEGYRATLRSLATELGVDERVTFIDRFLGLDELAALLGASDVVCTPYRGEDQSVSGVLTFALAAGCPVVSTPYRYARDVLSDGAGRLVPFGDHEAFASALAELLDGPSAVRARLAARRASSQMSWPQVGVALRSVLTAAIGVPARRAPSGWPSLPASQLPPAELGTAHLRVLCDDTAVLQHAHYTVPRLEDGYCVDDAGRVLPILDHLAAAGGDPTWHTATGRVLAFLRAAAADGSGQMRNFMSWDRRWLDEPYVGDHLGRAIWGVGELVAASGPFADQARELLHTLTSAIARDWPDKTLTYAALGLVAAAALDPDWDETLDPIVDVLRTWTPASARWPWFRARLDYDNGRVPEALIRAGAHIGDQRMIDNGAEMLHWLDGVCRQGDMYRFPGHHGLSDVRELDRSGDEQPLEASALADAHHAWHCLRGDRASLPAIERAWTWFLGNNRLGEQLVDLHTGAGNDGLRASGVNRNCGAESTIAAHRCALTYRASRATSLTTEHEGSVSRVRA